MTKELTDDMKLHLNWLVKKLTDDGYQLKEVSDTMKYAINNARDNVVVKMHLDKKRNVNIEKDTGYSSSVISTILSNYWSKKMNEKRNEALQQK